jgi:ABC-2 type transport system permease protein
VTDLLTRFANAFVVQVIAAFSVMTHFEAFQRGVLDTRDVIFFVSVIGFALFTTGVIIRNQRAG